MKRILVVDDTQRHLDAAKQQLSGPDTEVVTTTSYWEALLMLKRTSPLYTKTEELIEKFDVVLSDLLMPAAPNQMGAVELGYEGGKHVGLEFPAGWGLLFVAVKHGVPLIGEASVCSHHNHPAAAIMDFISGRNYYGAFKAVMNSSTVVITGNPPTLRVEDSALDRSDQWTKDWATLLRWVERAAAGVEDME